LKGPDALYLLTVDQPNVTNALPDVPLRMNWLIKWGGGYHYMRMEGEYRDGGNDFGYRTHTGRRFIEVFDPATNQGPDSVSYHHFFEVKIPVTPFTVAGDLWEATVLMDINEWYRDPVFSFKTFFPNGQGGIMVNLLAQRLLMENGRRCFSATNPSKL